MNVYDFDGTIYDGDSTVDFYIYCLRKQPWIIIYALRQALGFLRHAFGTIDTTQLKEEFFSFLPALDDPETLAASFWEIQRGKIKNWYLDRKLKSDVVVSASPEFLLRPICASLGIEPPIATRMEPKSGKIQGKNCKGAEKLLRFVERFPQEDIQQFYSDSLTDSIMAELAAEAFYVKKDNLLPWSDQSSFMKSVK